MGRLAVVGDVGGHVDELYRALVGLGMHGESTRLPDGLVVCQVDDLVHHGPASDGVVEFAERPDTIRRRGRGGDASGPDT
jgi:hypothetical protein